MNSTKYQQNKKYSMYRKLVGEAGIIRVYPSRKKKLKNKQRKKNVEVET